MDLCQPNWEGMRSAGGHLSRLLQMRQKGPDVLEISRVSGLQVPGS